MKNTNNTFLAIALLAITSGSAARCSASPSFAERLPFFPGYVIYHVPLRTVLPDHLKQASAYLAQGNPSAAISDFRSEAQKNPDDLAAQVGLLQCTRDEWDKLLPRYIDDDNKHASGTNDFRLGLLALYIIMSQTSVTNKSVDLASIAGDSLRRAYDKTHSPVAGFVCYSSGCSLGEDPSVILEDMLTRVGGPTISEQYTRASKADWRFPVPPVPHLESASLFMVSRILGCLASVRSGQSGAEDPITHEMRWTPVSPEDKAAMDFLVRWRDELKDASTISYSAI